MPARGRYWPLTFSTGVIALQSPFGLMVESYSSSRKLSSTSYFPVCSDEYGPDPRFAISP